jgi:hypothetical protein
MNLDLTSEEDEFTNRKYPEYPWSDIEKGFKLLMKKHQELSRKNERESFK